MSFDFCLSFSSHRFWESEIFQSSFLVINKDGNVSTVCIAYI